MNCKRVDNLMVDYIYGEMIPAEREAFEAHLAECPECAAMVEGLGGVRGMVADLPDPEPSRIVTNKIITHAREEAEKPKSVWGFGWVKMLATFCVIGVVGGLFIFQNQTGIFSEEKAMEPEERTAQHKSPAPEPAAEPMPEPAAKPAPPTRSIAPAESEKPAKPRSRSIMVAENDTPDEPHVSVMDDPHRVAGTTLVIEPDPEPVDESTEKSHRIAGTSLVIEPDPIGPAPEAEEQPSPEINGSLTDEEPPVPAKKSAAPKPKGGSTMAADTGAPKPGLSAEAGRAGREKASGDAMEENPTAVGDEGGAQVASLQKDTVVPKADEERMPDLFEQGKQAMGAGSFDDATGKFQAALNRLSPGDNNRPRVLLWLARSYEYRGMTSMAVDTYKQLAEESSEYYEFAHHKIRQLSE